MVSASLTGSTTAGSLLVSSFNAPIAAQLQVVVVFNQNAEEGGAMSCTIGVDLVGRPA
jgi:hypothetical protein